MAFEFEFDEPPAPPAPPEALDVDVEFPEPVTDPPVAVPPVALEFPPVAFEVEFPPVAFDVEDPPLAVLLLLFVALPPVS